MNTFWTENKWYIISVIVAFIMAIAYVGLSSGPSNMLPEVYSVM